MEVTVLKPGVVTVDNFLSSDECDDFISMAEDRGFEEATVKTGMGHVMMKSVRNNTRCIIDDFSLAYELWPRVEPHLDLFGLHGKPLCLNERFRFYKYINSQRFNRHRDGTERIRGMTSYITFMIYLNDDYEGGETVFTETAYNESGIPTELKLTVNPVKGRALMFLHRLYHEGARVKSGCKYVIRTDVFYDK